jgi:hypothetical protein
MNFLSNFMDFFAIRCANYPHFFGYFAKTQSAEVMQRLGRLEYDFVQSVQGRGGNIVRADE